MIIGILFKTFEEKFAATSDRQIKLSKAMLFEANYRLMGHPYDLIGLRRLKLFENSLKNSLEQADNDKDKKTLTDTLKEMLSQDRKSVV